MADMLHVEAGRTALLMLRLPPDGASFDKSATQVLLSYSMPKWLKAIHAGFKSITARIVEIIVEPSGTRQRWRLAKYDTHPAEVFDAVFSR